MKWTSERVLEMHATYMDSDKSLREVGELYGISYERVRQLFAEYELPKRERSVAAARRDAQTQEADDRQDEIIALYQELGSITDVAQAIELPIAAVRDVVNAYPLREAYRKHGEVTTYTDDEIIFAIQKAAALVGEPLSRNAYQALAPDHKLPAHYTIERHFETWYAACEAAGVETFAQRGPRDSSIQREDCSVALIACAAEIGHVPSYSEYNRWASGNDEAPSGSTVRKKFPNWKSAVTETFEGALTTA